MPRKPKPPPPPKRRQRGSGTIVARADGRFLARLPDRRGSKVCTSRGAAEAWLSRALDPSPAAASRAETVAAYLARWLRHRAPTLALRSRRPYELAVVRALPRLGHLALGAVAADDARDLFADLAARYAPATLHLTRDVLLAAFKQAVEDGVLESNPFRRVRLPKPGPSPARAWEPEQAVAFLAWCAETGHPYALLFELALSTGLRRGELCGLAWDDLDARARTLTVRRSIGQVRKRIGPPKGKKERTIKLSAALVEKLRERRRAVGLRSRWMFVPSVGDGPIAPNGLTASFGTAVRACPDVPAIRLHDLRHGFATMALGRGHNIKAVSEMLGHHSVTLTLARYAHVLKSQDDALAEDMGALLAPAPPDEGQGAGTSGGD